MANPRTPFICACCAQSLRQPTRSFATATAINPSRRIEQVKGTSAPSEDLPRWKRTPPAMKMPIRLRPLPQNQPTWEVNDKDEPVNAMYDRFIGETAGSAAAGQEGMAGRSSRGRELLDEEIKWLAVTHKSFDHAKRGFNDRLAFLGRRILDLQTSLALLNSPVLSSPPPQGFRSQSLQGLENITLQARGTALDRTRLAGLAYQYGVDKVVRWKPKKSDRLKESGVEAVLAHTMYAVIGALALQRGGEVAVRVARERILGPLGLKA